MPLQAVALKKYRGGTSPVSKMSDNEHAAAALWNSKVLSVQCSVGEPIPEFCQRPEEGAKRPSLVNRQDAGDVLPHQPRTSQSLSQRQILKRQVTARIVQPLSESSHAEGLAGGSANKQVNRFDSGSAIAIDPCKVAEVGHFGVVVFEDGRRERFDLRKGGSFPAEWFPCAGRGFDPAAHAEVSKRLLPVRTTHR